MIPRGNTLIEPRPFLLSAAIALTISRSCALSIRLNRSWCISARSMSVPELAAVFAISMSLSWLRYVNREIAFDRYSPDERPHRRTTVNAAPFRLAAQDRQVIVGKGWHCTQDFPDERPMPGALPTGAQTYRLVVRASPSAKKQFVWEMVLTWTFDSQNSTVLAWDRRNRPCFTPNRRCNHASNVPDWSSFGLN